MDWQERFDRLLKTMSAGQPHKAEKRSKSAAQSARQKSEVRLPKP
jgi:hypothetical protein